jgi:hypothetical protein
MKKITFLVIFGIMCASLNFADENQSENSINVYTFFVNIVNENFHFPLIGFVNIAAGSHSFPQIGFVNVNQDNFTGLQAGFVNTVGGNLGGLQLGFVNTTIKSVDGVQLGFVSTAVNGFNGAQISFINIAKKINGIQLGFINYAESIENGIPLGFISIVRNGGYKAVELSINELAAVNIAFKIGIDKLYTSINVSYNPLETDIKESIFTGMGLGSIIPINEKFFFNPELVYINPITGSTQNYLSLVPNFGYKIISGLSVLIGPSITWAYTKKDTEPFFSIITYKINEQNSFLLGGRMALRLQW